MFFLFLSRFQNSIATGLNNVFSNVVIPYSNSLSSGLIREIKEETGMNFKKEDTIYLLKMKIYVRNHPRCNSLVKVNKLVETDYFYIKSNECVKKYEELKQELEYLKILGLDAIKISHSNQSEEYRNMLRCLRDELKIYETGGSDFHGPTVQSDIELGTGRNNNTKIKQLSLINKIKS